MPFFYFDPAYMLAIAPAMLLAMWAQWRVHATFAAASQEPAPLSGAAAARHILDSAGATEVAVEQVPGTLTDHYDPRTKVLRLSDAVYSSRSLAAVGIAAHEAGHALQDHTGYPLMSLRNAAVGIANIGSGVGLTVFMVTHDLASLNTVCDRVAALADGKIVAIGPMRELLQSEHPWVRAYFHGKRSQMLQPKAS